MPFHSKEERMNRITRRVARPRTALLLGVAALLVFAVGATAAQAKVFNVTGGEATFTPSSQLKHALSSHGVTAEAIAPATLTQGGVLSMPVVGGHVAKPSGFGDLRLGGGVKFTKDSHSLALGRMVAIRGQRGAFLTARVAGERRVIARFIHVHKSVSNGTATLSADVVLSAQAARLINHRVGHHVVSAGAPLGNANATVTFG
jgi:hypothetical protein